MYLGHGSEPTPSESIYGGPQMGYVRVTYSFFMDFFVLQRVC